MISWHILLHGMWSLIRGSHNTLEPHLLDPKFGRCKGMQQWLIWGWLVLWAKLRAWSGAPLATRSCSSGLFFSSCYSSLFSVSISSHIFVSFSVCLLSLLGKIPGPRKPLFGHVFSVCLSVLAFLTSNVIVWRFLVSVGSRKVLALRKPDGDKQGLEIRDLRSQIVSCLGLVFPCQGTNMSVWRQYGWSLFCVLTRGGKDKITMDMEMFLQTCNFLFRARFRLS